MAERRADTLGDTAPSRATMRTPRRNDANATLALQWVFPSFGVTRLDRPSVIGRDESCGTRLVGAEVSRRHAAIEVEGRLAVLADQDSRNGVYVDGARVRDAALTRGTVVRVGEWVGVVVPEDDVHPVVTIAPGWLGGAALLGTADQARRIAPTTLPVVLRGATGTGKEGLARAIHAWSGRTGPFSAVNCAAIAPGMAEAELFGYRKGAFTGADQASPGMIRGAHRGTLLLDEITDLPLDTQAKLLRVLEQGEVHPLGAPVPARVDVRIVAATQVPLEIVVAAGAFRADLHARLDGLTIDLPTLAERRADIAPLFVHFVRDAMGGRPLSIDARLIERLCLHDWPMNVRELAQLARRLVALAGHEGALTVGHLPNRLRAAPDAPASAPVVPRSAPATPKRAPVSAEGEFDALVEALRAHEGNVARAAVAAGISRFRAYRLLRAHPEFDWKATRTPS